MNMIPYSSEELVNLLRSVTISDLLKSQAHFEAKH